MYLSVPFQNISSYSLILIEFSLEFVGMYFLAISKIKYTIANNIPTYNAISIDPKLLIKLFFFTDIIYCNNL